METEKKEITSSEQKVNHQKEKIIELCKQNKISIRKLESDLGISNGYIGKVKNGYPYDKVVMIAEYFGVNPSDIAGAELGSSKAFQKAKSIQQAFDERPEMRTLFQLAKDAPVEDIEYVIKKLKSLKEK